VKVSRRDRDGETTPSAAPAASVDDGRETLQDCLRKLVQLLPQVTRGLRRSQTPPTTEGAKLTPRHGTALSLLHEQGSLTVGQLAGQLGLTLPTTSGLIADVERAGFVQRTTDPADRRRTIVSLVPQHNDALGVWLAGANAPMARVLDQLSPDERAALLKGMSLLQAELNEEPGCPGLPAQNRLEH
jgi:DNA-binding MarR family transcriptional regulator